MISSSRCVRSDTTFFADSVEWYVLCLYERNICDTNTHTDRKEGLRRCPQRVLSQREEEGKGVCSDVFAVGLYQLDEVTNTRKGGMSLYCASFGSAEEVCRCRCYY